MPRHSCHFPLAIVVVLLATSVCLAQDDTVRPGGALIIIENNRIRIEGDARLLESDVIPTRQQLQIVSIQPVVRDLVAKLDSRDFADREAATRRLIDLNVDDVQLMALLERGEVSPEQRHRIFLILRERVLNKPRGALGIRMDAQQGQRFLPGAADAENPALGVTILEVIAGMPAEGVLRVGDRITHINNVGISSSEDLIDLVQTRRPGEIIKLRVQRPRRNDDGQVAQDEAGEPVLDSLDLEITLGTVTDLHDPRTPAPPSRLEIERRRIIAAVEQRYGNQSRSLEIVRR